MNSIDTLCLRIVQLLQENQGLRQKIAQLEKESKKNNGKDSKKFPKEVDCT